MQGPLFSYSTLQWIVYLIHIMFASFSPQGNSNMAAIISMAIFFLHKIVSSRMQLMNLLPWMSSGITTLPFACISDPIRKPIPLKLDVTFPPLPDVRWSISRLYYLFNSQLERNIVL